MSPSLYRQQQQQQQLQQQQDDDDDDDDDDLWSPLLCFSRFFAGEFHQQLAKGAASASAGICFVEEAVSCLLILVGDLPHFLQTLEPNLWICTLSVSSIRRTEREGERERQMERERDREGETEMEGERKRERGQGGFEVYIILWGDPIKPLSSLFRDKETLSSFLSLYLIR